MCPRTQSYPAYGLRRLWSEDVTWSKLLLEVQNWPLFNENISVIKQILFCKTAKKHFHIANETFLGLEIGCRTWNILPKLLHYECFTTKNFEIRSIFELRFFEVSNVRTSHYGIRFFEANYLLLVEHEYIRSFSKLFSKFKQIR